MTLEANTNSLDIEAKYKNNIDTTEFDILRASITNSAGRPQPTSTYEHGEYPMSMCFLERVPLILEPLKDSSDMCVP